MDGVPDDDQDILGKVQDDIDASCSFAPESEDFVADATYYRTLEVPPNATEAAIKRKYYILARKYHPDIVGPDDHVSANKFKAISEAYQVLSDPDLRKRYDKKGKAGLSADKTSKANSGSDVDPALLYAFLFGSDKFSNYVGRLSTATSASVGDSQDISLTDARKLQKRRVTRMALYLAEKVQPWVLEAQDVADLSCFKASVETTWKEEADKLSKASFGHQVVTTIGKVYNMVAVMYEGSMDSGQGLPSLGKWAARQQAALEKKRTKSDAEVEKMRATYEMAQTTAELEKMLAAAKTEEEKARITAGMNENVTIMMLRVMWTTTVVDITSAIHEASKMIFFDQAVDRKTQSLRAAAVRTLGHIFMECSAPEVKGAKTPTQIYEEAAFAAMIETMNRRDAASSSGK